MDKDYYAILGVHPSAEEAVISAAYWALAKLYHPDLYKGGDAADRMAKSSLNPPIRPNMLLPESNRTN